MPIGIKADGNFVIFLNPWKFRLDILNDQSREEGKDQELVQSSTTPDQEHHMGKVSLIWFDFVF